MKDRNQNIAILRALIETSVNRKISTSNDFIFLMGAIQGRINKHLGVSTLKRIWGYIDGYRSMRESTLDILSQFVGYPDYETFVSDYCDSEAARSSHRVMTRMTESKEIPTKALVSIEWNPNRKLVLRHDGGGKYCVLESVNSKVGVGVRFEIQSFIIGQPMILTNYQKGEEEPCTFVIGNKGGLTSIGIEKV